jgi:DNA (cytosine-5)-methyltransferase 1
MTEACGKVRSRPFALDLFCCGGGASMGLYRAGFNVVGIDIDHQPHYPFPFLQADALTLDPEWMAAFDFVWASPPCQRYTRGAKKWGTTDCHPDLIAPTRDLLESIGLPFVIENVPDAPVRADVTLCGSMFGLRVIRHRSFELSGVVVPQPEHGQHAADYVTVTGHTGGSSKRDGTAGFGTIEDWKEAMGIDWLPASKLCEAIPPAYSEHIGRRLLRFASQGGCSVTTQHSGRPGSRP